MCAVGRMLSGVVSKGVLVRDWDETDARLPVEELLLMVRTGVIVSGTELLTTTFWMSSSAAPSSDACSEGISAEPCPVVNMPGRRGKQRRVLSVRSRGSALWVKQTGIGAAAIAQKEQLVGRTWAELGPGGKAGYAGQFVFTGNARAEC